MTTPEALQDVSGSTSSKRILAFMAFFTAVACVYTGHETMAASFLIASGSFAGLTVAEWKLGGGTK